MINIKQLKEQLRQEATPTDTEELTIIALKLNSIPAPIRNSAFKESQLDKILGTRTRKRWLPFFAPALALFCLLLVGGVGVFAAQTSLPGQPLYSLKRLSEKATVIIHPDFKKELPVRRSQEIKDLVTENKHPDLIKNSIKDFQEEVDKRGRTKDNSSLEKSRQNLEDAKTHSSQEDREVIDKVITDLDKEDDNNEGKHGVKGDSVQENKRSKDNSPDTYQNRQNSIDSDKD